MGIAKLHVASLSPYSYLFTSRSNPKPAVHRYIDRYIYICACGSVHIYKLIIIIIIIKKSIINNYLTYVRFPITVSKSVSQTAWLKTVVPSHATMSRSFHRC